MSYATSLLMAYPPPYGPSTLLSDDLVQRSSLGAFYEPPRPYIGGSRLLSDNYTYNQIGLAPSSYRSATNYRTPAITDWQIDIPQPTSYVPINNIREHSRSLATTSNTNTASSMVRSRDENNSNGPRNRFSDYQQSHHRVLTDTNRTPHLKTIWSPTRSKISQNNEKPTSTHRSLPELSTTIVQKQTPVEELPKDTTPVPSPSPPPVLTKQKTNLHRDPTPVPSPSPPPVLTKQKTNLHRDPTPIEIKEQQPAVNVETRLSESRNESSRDEKPVEQTWTDKIDHLHTAQSQREKDKAKAARALPIIPKKVENKPRITSFQRTTESYFDSLFDGNYLRKTSINQQKPNSSYQQTLSSRNKSTVNPFNKSKTTISPKYLSPRKVPQEEPPTTMMTSPRKRQEPKQNQSDSSSPRENIHKDTEERFREALQKFRSDRAEQQQQQKEFTESTAKRLDYGNYVRRSTKDDLLHNIIKPSPWSDFLDMKRGNVYSLDKEEKKDLYNESKSYGERVRNRNVALYNNSETARSQHRSIPFPTENQEPQSDDETSDSKSTIKTTNKTYTRQTMHNDMISDHSGRTTKLTDQTSSTNRASDEDQSDFESSRKQKKRLYESSVQTTTVTEDSDNDETSEQQSTRMRNADTE